MTFILAFQLANKSTNTLQGKTAKFSQRKVQTWTNSILAVSLTATFAHILAFDFLRNNVAFMGLVGLYFAVAITSSTVKLAKDRKLAEV